MLLHVSSSKQYQYLVWWSQCSLNLTWVLYILWSTSNVVPYKWLGDNYKCLYAHMTIHHPLTVNVNFYILNAKFATMYFVEIWHVCLILYIEEFAFVFPTMNAPIPYVMLRMMNVENSQCHNHEFPMIVFICSQYHVPMFSMDLSLSYIHTFPIAFTCPQ